MAGPLPVSPLARQMPALPPIAGVKLATAAAGIRYQGRTDMLMAAFAEGTQVAGVFTRNVCPGAPVSWCREILPLGVARGLVVNAGNANVFTGAAGAHAAALTAQAAASVLGVEPTQIFLASTGVIGEQLPTEKLVAAMAPLQAGLQADAFAHAAQAIMTTDTFPKAATRTAMVGGQEIRLNGIAKGSGMIAPDMATMLSFLFTDAVIPAALLQTLLAAEVETSFNCVTIDSDTSTSDMVLLFATGQAAHAPVTDLADLADFKRALRELVQELAELVARDGEGAQKLVTVRVQGAVSDASAKRIGMAIANSPLVKTAIAGEDANWGRIVMAVGKAGEPANRDTLSIAIGGVWMARAGSVVAGYDEAPVVAHMRGQEIDVMVDLGLGTGQARILTCDLTHGYIDINGAYRS